MSTPLIILLQLGLSNSENVGRITDILVPLYTLAAILIIAGYHRSTGNILLVVRWVEVTVLGGTVGRWDVVCFVERSNGLLYDASILLANGPIFLISSLTHSHHDPLSCIYVYGSPVAAPEKPKVYALEKKVEKPANELTWKQKFMGTWEALEREGFVDVRFAASTRPSVQYVIHAGSY